MRGAAIESLDGAFTINAKPRAFSHLENWDGTGGYLALEQPVRRKNINCLNYEDAETEPASADK